MQHWKGLGRQQIMMRQVLLMNEQHVDDLLDLYALGALDPQEQAATEAHLRTCERCRAQLSEAQRVTELLAWTPDQYDPPAYLRDRVLQRVATLQRGRAGARANVLAAAASSVPAAYCPLGLYVVWRYAGARAGAWCANMAASAAA